MQGQHQQPTGAVMAPVSPAIAKLLHKLQAEIIKQVDAQPAPPGGLVLAALERKSIEARVYSVGGDQALMVDDAQGYRYTLYRDRTPRADDPNWHPAHWWGSEYRRAQDGTEWSRSLPRHVCDDFGQLVPVGGAQ